MSHRIDSSSLKNSLSYLSRAHGAAQPVVTATSLQDRQLEKDVTIALLEFKGHTASGGLHPSPFPVGHSGDDYQQNDQSLLI